MPKYKKVDAELMEQPAKRNGVGRPLSPEQQEMVRRMKTLTDESVVYEVTLEPDEKPATVRQQLLRAAKTAGVEVAVKKSPKGFYVGLMTSSRRNKRGRRPAASNA